MNLNGRWALRRRDLPGIRAFGSGLFGRPGGAPGRPLRRCCRGRVLRHEMLRRGLDNMLKTKTFLSQSPPLPWTFRPRPERRHSRRLPLPPDPATRPAPQRTEGVHLRLSSPRDSAADSAGGPERSPPLQTLRRGFRYPLKTKHFLSTTTPCPADIGAPAGTPAVMPIEPGSRAADAHGARSGGRSSIPSAPRRTRRRARGRF
jgi:hypothetical protein